jgi:hypothetical protein
MLSIQEQGEGCPECPLRSAKRNLLHFKRAREVIKPHPRTKFSPISLIAPNKPGETGTVCPSNIRFQLCRAGVRPGCRSDLAALDVPVAVTPPSSRAGGSPWSPVGSRRPRRAGRRHKKILNCETVTICNHFSHVIPHFPAFSCLSSFSGKSL